MADGYHLWTKKGYSCRFPSFHSLFKFKLTSWLLSFLEIYVSLAHSFKKKIAFVLKL